MKNTILVELKNDNALNLLYDLEKMNIIHLVKDYTPNETKFSEKFRGILTKEQRLSLKEHVKLSSQEWERDIL